jgi:hypothetical protein
MLPILMGMKEMIVIVALLTSSLDASAIRSRKYTQSKWVFSSIAAIINASTIFNGGVLLVSEEEEEQQRIRVCSMTSITFSHPNSYKHIGKLYHHHLRGTEQFS